MGERIAKLALVFAACMLLSYSIPVTAFSSSRTSSNQNQIDFYASNEDFVTELKHEIEGPDFSGINSVDDAMQVLNQFIIQIAEDFAEDATKTCHSVGTPIDYSSVKNDLIDCLKSTVEIISAKAMQISLSFSMRKTEFERYMNEIQSAISDQLPLSKQQKEFVTNNFFNPICSTLIPAMSECDDPKYATLSKAGNCKSEAEKDAEEYVRRVVKDICRNDGAWIFDFLDAKPMQCAADYQRAAKSEQFQQCDRYFDEYKVNKNRPGQTRRIDTGVEFCNFTGKAGECMSDLLVTSCKENPKPGQVLLNTFRDARNFWSTKCGACVNTVFWPLWILCLVAIIPNWIKNLF